MNELTTRTLPVITEEIRYLDQQAKRLVLGHAIEIGRRLTEAKALVQHGEWESWLREEVRYSTSSANNFMQIFKAYGATQQSLFGPVAVSEELGNLPYTKALALLAVPEEERERFVAEHPVEEMSVRELKQAIKERDEAIRERDEARKLADTRRETAADAIEDAAKAEAKLLKSERKREELQKRVSELENRPVEVAVQRDEAAIQKAVQEAEKAAAEKLKAEKATIKGLKSQLSESELRAKTAAESLEESRRLLREAEEKLQKAQQSADTGKLEEAQAEAQRLREAADKAERKAALGEAAALFKQWQGLRNQLMAALATLDEGNRERMTKAVQAQARMWAESIEEAKC